MNLIGNFTKAPGETTPYTVLYSDDLEAGDTVNAAAATVDGDALLIIDYVIFTNDPTLGPFAKVMLSGGTSGTKYTVTVTSKSVAGRVMIDTFTVTIR
ncbi:MAG: hypothetical protein WDN30_14085 [Pararobbsia sp.]